MVFLQVQKASTVEAPMPTPRHLTREEHHLNPRPPQDRWRTQGQRMSSQGAKLGLPWACTRRSRTKTRRDPDAAAAGPTSGIAEILYVVPRSSASFTTMA